MIEDLKICFKEKIGWFAGDQIKALKYYLQDYGEILSEYMQDNYQGECGAVIKANRKFWVWFDSFGSCNGCDALEGQDGFKYIQDTMTNVKEFESIEDVKKFLSEKVAADYPERWDVKGNLLKNLNEKGRVEK